MKAKFKDTPTAPSASRITALGKVVMVDKTCSGGKRTEDVWTDAQGNI